MNANSQRTNRGIDTPTVIPIHDDNSNSNQLLRILAPVGSRGTLAFDYSNQLAQFQIPINVDPNNPNDPQISCRGPTTCSASASEQFAQLGSPAVFQNVQQAGSQIGLYAQDKWSPSQIVSVDYGLRYDHSTGFVGGNQLSPRIGVNGAPDGKNVVHFYYGRFYAAPQLEDVRGACVAPSVRRAAGHSLAFGGCWGLWINVPISAQHQSAGANHRSRLPA